VSDESNSQLPVNDEQLFNEELARHRSTESWIYGLILTGTSLAASTQHEHVVYVALTVIVTVLVFWVAHTYAHLSAARAVLHRKLTRLEIAHGFGGAFALVTSCFIPLGVLILLGIFGANTDTATYIALGVAAVMIAGTAGVGAYRSDVRGWRLAGATALGLAMGLALIGLKLIVLH
jgi:hypothetical protein